MKISLPSLLLGITLFLGIGAAVQYQESPLSCDCLTQAQKDVLALLSVETLDDCISGPGYKTLRVTGANFQVVNGLGVTNTENGLGNLIVGYQENSSVVCDRTGSHNVVGGLGNAYGSYGGFVMGLHNYFESCWW